MNEIREIKKLISEKAYGIKTDKGIRPSATKHYLKNGFVRPPSNRIIKKHTENNETVYFYGSENDETIVMIDIDVNKKNKKGSKKGAIEFAEHIDKNMFKTYIEPSTNGEGIHSYFILDKKGYKADQVNIILKQLQNWLQEEAKKINADIELVEVKGTLFEIKYKNKKITEIKYGMLGKIPRNIKQIINNKNLIKIEDIKNNFNLEKINKIKNGSIKEKHFNEEHLSNLENYKKIAYELIGSEQIKANKFNITHIDVAIAIMFLKFFKENKNEDGTLPTKRIEKLWKAVYKAGDITRGWNHHRWKGIRDILSKKGLIKWIENKYQITDKRNNVEGIACKWEISDKMYMYIQKSEKEEGSSLMDTRPLKEIELIDKSVSLTDIFKELLCKIDKIMFEYAYKVPVLSIILNKNNDLTYETAYSYIKNQFCEV